MLHNIVLQGHIHDMWRWILDPVDGYSVKGTYQYPVDASSERGLFDAVWQKQVPSKVSVFAWRLLRNRLPTKDNLVCRHVLHHDDMSCIGDCDSFETTFHLIFDCDISDSVWHLLYRWLDISFIPPDTVHDHLHQFGHLMGLPRFTHSFLKIIWLACVWVIWKERNNMIFKQKALVPD